MVRKFVTGVVLGGAVAAGGLVVVSQIVPMGRSVATSKEVASTDATEAPIKPSAQVTAPDAPGADATKAVAAPPQPAPVEDPQALEKAATETDEPLLRPLNDPNAPPPAAVAPDLTPPAAPAQAPEVDDAPTSPDVTAKAEEAEVVTDTAPAPKEPEVAKGPAQDTGEDAAQETGQASSITAQDAPEIAAPDTPEPGKAANETEEPAPAGTGTAQDNAPDGKQVLPETATLDEAPPVATPTPSVLPPDPQLEEKTVEGVTTGRLPSIGTAKDGATGAEAALLPQDGGQAGAPAILGGFVRSFDNPDGKPLYAILLRDDGSAEVPRAELAALPFPITFVLDPLDQASEEAAALYREAGQEVVMLASAIPKGAKASDLEQSFAGIGDKLSGAVALIDTETAAFQEDRKLSAEVVTLLADRRLGLVTFDRGLNAADQVARREGLPAAMIFRSIDDDGEEAPVIRRYLDRAAFKAAQEGEVAVIGTARPDTIAALMEWAVEGRASSVALAPISALLLR